VKIRVNKILFRGKVEMRDAAGPILKHSGEFVIVERGKPRLIILRCPCGCGDDLLINVDRRVGKAWRYYRNQYGMSLYPSYWRDSACKSHFIIWNNNIYWCSGWETEGSDLWFVSKELEEIVLTNLSSDHFTKYYDLADRLELVPWEVLQACRQLARQRLVESGEGDQHNEFRRTGDGRYD
jgi:hypothetical protein